MGRNTPFLESVVDALGSQIVGSQIEDKTLALQRLEDFFANHYVLDAGNVNDIAEFAAELRLDITESERDIVLDYIAEQSMVGIGIDIVEDAINSKFPNRFIEP